MIIDGRVWFFYLILWSSTYQNENKIENQTTTNRPLDSSNNNSEVVLGELLLEVDRRSKNPEVSGRLLLIFIFLLPLNLLTFGHTSN